MIRALAGVCCQYLLWGRWEVSYAVLESTGSSRTPDPQSQQSMQ